MRFETRAALVTAGVRHLPVKRTSYLARDSSVLSQPVRRESVFLRPLPGLWIPGLYSVRSLEGPGIFLSSPDGILFAAVHPAGSAGLSIDYDDSVRIFADARRERFGENLPWTWEGFAYASLRGLRLEAARKKEWDLIDGKIDPGRKGRSALASVVYDFQFGAIEMAGQDTGRDSFRAAGATLDPVSDFLGMGPVIRGRLYRFRRYASAAAGREERALAGGWKTVSGAIELQVLCEGRSEGPPSAEIAAAWQRRTTSVSLSAFYLIGSVRGDQTHLLRTRPDYDTGARFYRREVGGLTLKVRADFLYLSAELSRTPDHMDRYAAAEVRYMF